MKNKIISICIALLAIVSAQSQTPNKAVGTALNFDVQVLRYTNANIDSTSIASTIQRSSQINIIHTLSDTTTVNRTVSLPTATSKEINIRLITNTSNYLEVVGDLKVNGLYTSKYKVENDEEIKLTGVDGYWIAETDISKYPDYYVKSKLYDFSRHRIGEYMVVGTENRISTYASAFSEYDRINIPVPTKYDGYENLILASNQVGQRITPYGWQDENASTPKLYDTRVNAKNPYGENGTTLVQVLENNAGIFAHLESYTVVDSGEYINVSFWMKMVSDTSMIVNVRGILGGGDSWTTVPVTVSSQEWKRYNATIQSTGKVSGRREIVFRFTAAAGTKFYWDNTTVRRGTEMSFDVITDRDFYYGDVEEDMVFTLNPTKKGLVNTSDLIFPDSTYNPRVVFQQTLDYCQETENCSGLHVSGVYEIDSTIFIHHAQRLESDCTIPDETFMDRDKIANSSRLEFNPPDSLPDLTFIRFDSTTRRVGTETIPKSIIIRNIYLVVMDTCATVIELESAGMPVIKVVGIEGNDMASRGISFGNVGHAASGRTSLFPLFESVYVNKCDVGMYLEKANYLSINYCRVIGNRVGVHVVNSGRISIIGTWFESNYDEDILIDRSRQFISRENYFERTLALGTGVNYSLNFKNVSTLSFYDNTLRAASLLDGYMYLDTVRRANIIGNYYDNSNLYDLSGNTDTYVVDLSNMQNESSDENQPENHIDNMLVEDNEVRESKISYNNTFANQQFISGLALKGKRQNLIIKSDTLITTVTNTSTFTRLSDTIVGPFGDSISRIIYEQIDDIGSGSTDFANNGGSPVLQVDTTYVFSFWGKIIEQVDSSSGISVVARHWTDDDASAQFALTTDWKEYSYEFTASLTTSTMVFRIKGPAVSVPGDRFALCKGSLYKKSSGDMGYVETEATVVDDSLLVVELNESLKYQSTLGGIGIPSMTSAQRDLLTPFSGLVIFNSTTNKHQGYDGSGWNDLY